MQDFFTWIADQAPITIIGNQDHYSAAIRQSSDDEARRGLCLITSEIERISEELRSLSQSKTLYEKFYEEIERLSQVLSGAQVIRDKFRRRLKKSNVCNSQEGPIKHLWWSDPLAQ